MGDRPGRTARSRLERRLGTMTAPRTAATMRARRLLAVVLVLNTTLLLSDQVVGWWRSLIGADGEGGNKPLPGPLAFVLGLRPDTGDAERIWCCVRGRRTRRAGSQPPHDVAGRSGVGLECDSRGATDRGH
jgi:hypothetical protein